MKRILTFTAVALALSTGAALAETESACDVPMNQWQSTDVLTTQLASEGWTVRRIKTEGGCYDVSAVDKDGNRMQAAFDPKTLEKLDTEVGG